MAKKIKHVPSDFSKPKPGTYVQKTTAVAPKKRVNKMKFKPPTEVEPKPEFAEKKKKRFIPTNPIDASTQRVKIRKDDKQPREEKVLKEVKAKKQTGNAETAKKRFLGEDKYFKPYEAFNNQQKSAPVKPVDIKLESMPLNKYVAHCGICSRREAAELIKKGKVKVNSLVEVEPGTKVTEQDYIIYEGNRIFPQRKLVYYLLNKPKNTITTTDDPEGRYKVMDLLTAAPEQNVYPVGRLDRNTTGLLLLTNDGDLAQRLTHPKYNIKKIYQVTLDKPLKKEDFQAILDGVLLEDGKAVVDDLAYTDPKDKKEIGIQIHIGRNRIVRRIFESLHYQVKALDRVVYAGLTKKNLQRGHWRELTEKEVIFLKHFK